MQYTPDEWQDLAGYLRPHAEDADGTVASWAKSFLSAHPHHATDVIRRMLDAIGTTFSYQAREAEGTQSPGQTLRSKSGTCPDYAWLMIEALRRIGSVDRPPATLGEHTDEILREAGYGDADIAEMRTHSVV